MRLFSRSAAFQRERADLADRLQLTVNNSQQNDSASTCGGGGGRGGGILWFFVTCTKKTKNIDGAPDRVR